MIIFTEATPNPDAKRFMLPDGVVIDAPREYRSDDSAPPAVARLLELEGVAAVMVGVGFVTVRRRSADVAWPELTGAVISQIGASLDAGESWMPEAAPPADAPVSLVAAQIEDILKRQVAPQIARDGGDIELISFDESTGVVTVALKGACGGCPSATMTLRNGVEAILKRYVPEVRSVRAETKRGSHEQPFWRRLLGSPRAA